MRKNKRNKRPPVTQNPAAKPAPAPAAKPAPAPAAKPAPAPAAKPAPAPAAKPAPAPAAKPAPAPAAKPAPAPAAKPADKKTKPEKEAAPKAEKPKKEKAPKQEKPKKPEKEAAPEKGKKSDIKFSKKTLNLNMKERSTISTQTFVLVLAIILAFLVVIEYFGVYSPYRNLEKEQAAFQSEQAELDKLKDDLKDYDSVRDDFNRYNYTGYDTSIVDREDILALLDELIFDKYENVTISGLTINKNVVSFTIIGLDMEALTILRGAFLQKPIVAACSNPRTQGGEEIPTAPMEIVFKNAPKEEGGNN